MQARQTRAEHQHLGGAGRAAAPRQQAAGRSAASSRCGDEAAPASIEVRARSLGGRLERGDDLRALARIGDRLVAHAMDVRRGTAPDRRSGCATRTSQVKPPRPARTIASE
ncbi:MAG: hypothetical protein U1F11_12895 [Steroidobacteraceae bacterium]